MGSIHPVVSIAAVIALLLGVAAVVRKRSSFVSWCFFLGMVVLAAESVLGGLAMAATDGARQIKWLTWQRIAESFLPAPWLAFSLAYCRGNAREFLSRWWMVLVLMLVLPPAIAIAWRSSLVSVVSSGETSALVSGRASQVLHLLVLVAGIGILGNLEKTFRTAVGTVRWRIKYLFIGAGLVFGARIYTLSQGLLLSRLSPSTTMLETVALLLGCLLMGIAYWRRGFENLDIYPSRSVLHGSLILVLVGAYLLVVGVLAELVPVLGLADSFPIQAFCILLGVAGLAVLLWSDRARTALQRFITRHFRRPQHDAQEIWSTFTRRTSGEMERALLCRKAADVLSSSFETLTVRVFVRDGDDREFVLAASTFDGEGTGDCIELDREPAFALRDGLKTVDSPFDLESLKDQWLQPLRDACPSQFGHGGNRLGLPLRSGDRLLGVMVLADRVNGIPFSVEERDLLNCLGEQLSASLLNLVLNAEQMQSRELEAFQTMSTFFIHDLKNAANNLGLTVQNLPTDFDDPEFREEALHGLRRITDRINRIIAKITTLRTHLRPSLAEQDLNKLIGETLDNLARPEEGPELVCDLHAIPPVQIDSEQIRSVLTNLVSNAAEAAGEEGRIRIGTTRQNGSVVLEVTDNGCGMSREFIRKSLFRPFQSTKNKGLGIGMFQCRMIVEAHRGRIDVQSEPGKGTSFRVALPVATKVNS